MAATKLKYYHGEKSNPYEEINENQGAHAMRYNKIASKLWGFEYHWANGWDKYKALDVRHSSSYFELYKEPQKSFTTIEDALLAFFEYEHESWAVPCSDKWAVYIYEHAMLERFYKPIFNIVPKEDIPKFLLYYHGEYESPKKYVQTIQGDAYNLWWNIEFSWYKSSIEHEEKDWHSYLSQYLMRNTEHHPGSDEYKKELGMLIERYKGWVK